jgi:hypothetical protein
MPAEGNHPALASVAMELEVPEGQRAHAREERLLVGRADQLGLVLETLRNKWALRDVINAAGTEIATPDKIYRSLTYRVALSTRNNRRIESENSIPDSSETSCINFYSSLAWSTTAFATDQRIKAPIAATLRCDEQEDEAEQDSGHALVLNWPSALRRVKLPIRDRHHP